MFCVHCGNKLNPDDNFCGRCGNKVVKLNAKIEDRPHNNEQVWQENKLHQSEQLNDSKEAAKDEIKEAVQLNEEKDDSSQSEVISNGQNEQVPPSNSGQSIHQPYYYGNQNKYNHPGGQAYPNQLNNGQPHPYNPNMHPAYETVNYQQVPEGSGSPLVPPQYRHLVQASAVTNHEQMQMSRSQNIEKKPGLTVASILLNTIFALVLLISAIGYFAESNDILSIFYGSSYRMVIILLIFQVISILLQWQQKSYSILAPIILTIIYVPISIIATVQLLRVLTVYFGYDSFEVPFFAPFIIETLLHILYIIIGLVALYKNRK